MANVLPFKNMLAYECSFDFGGHFVQNEKVMKIPMNSRSKMM